MWRRVKVSIFEESVVHTAWDHERDRDQNGHNRKQWLAVPVPAPVPVYCVQYIV